MGSSSRRRGTASVEIVVMLPVFTLLFFGVYHLHQVGSAALTTVERARGCAFEFAALGCEQQAKQAELCRGVVAAKADSVEQADQARHAQGEPGVALERPSISDQIETIPVVGALWTAVFGEGSIASANVAAPLFMTQGEQTLQTQHYMVCNTVTKTWDQLRKEQLCGLAEQLGMSLRVFGC